jgi:hypothetical protein
MLDNAALKDLLAKKMVTPAGKREDALKQSPEPRFCGRDAEEDQNNDDDGNAEQKPCAPLAPLSTKGLAIVVRHKRRREHSVRIRRRPDLPLNCASCPLLSAQSQSSPQRFLLRI